jgi:thymidylate synthase (FAD)
MKVTTIAHTVFYPNRAKEALGYIPQEDFLGVEAAWTEWENVTDNSPMDVDYEARVAAARDYASDLEDTAPTGSDELAECAGRNCYQAWNRPNPATQTTEGYLANIISQGHESVLEHSSLTVAVTGVSTALLGQLSRHRHLSFSVLSKRYVDEGDSEYVVHPNLERFMQSEIFEPPQISIFNQSPSVGDTLQDIHDDIRTVYKQLVVFLEGKGLSKKQAREIARGVLPQATETRMVVSGNFRAWRDVLRKRLHPAADAEIQRFARLVLIELKKVAPSSFQDFEVPA